MEGYECEKGTSILLVCTFLTYFLMPPALATYIFEWLNLNPFNIVKGWHFNPFSADRGIPFYQTFFYLLTIWFIVNLVMWGGVLLLFRLYQGYKSRSES